MNTHLKNLEQLLINCIINIMTCIGHREQNGHFLDILKKSILQIFQGESKIKLEL
jgi:hypothetical protein